MWLEHSKYFFVRYAFFDPGGLKGLFERALGETLEPIGALWSTLWTLLGSPRAPLDSTFVLVPF